MDLFWELLIIIAAIVLILVLFEFGMRQKRKDLTWLQKYFDPKH